MIDFSRVRNYYIACGYTDMRKQIDGLVAVVQLQFGHALDEESLFLFCGHRADRTEVEQPPQDRQSVCAYPYSHRRCSSCVPC